MDVVIDIKKTVDQNAELYFEKSKKYKHKIPGILKIVEEYKSKLKHIELEKNNYVKEKPTAKSKKWFEKFRWFVSSDGFLVIGGRDATSNDIIVKKNVEQNDIVFHTELAGSPFVIIKNPDAQDIPKTTINEAAEFCASFSKSWKAERTSAEVYYVNPDQVSKEAKSGEYLQKGSFMIYGKRNFIDAKLNVGIGLFEGKIMSGPLSAVKKHSKDCIEIIQGNEKMSDVAKKIKKILGGELDDIIRALPSECTIRKQR